MACLYIAARSFYFENVTSTIDLLNAEIFSGRACSILLWNTRACVEDGSVWLIAIFLPTTAAILIHDNAVRAGILFALVFTSLLLGSTTIYMTMNDSPIQGNPALILMGILIALSFFIAIVSAPMRLYVFVAPLIGHVFSWVMRLLKNP
jgi:hypothetical protein